MIDAFTPTEKVETLVLRRLRGPLATLSSVFVTSALLASPAAAEPPSPITITHQADCNHTTGVESIVYTVTNVSAGSVHLHVRFFGPNGGHLSDAQDRDLAADQTTAYNETVDSSTQAALGLNVTVGSGQPQVVGSGQLRFSCAEAHATTVTGVGTCNPATGSTTVTWSTATAQPKADPAELRFDVVTVQPGGQQAAVRDPRTVTGILPGGTAHFVETIAPGRGTASLSLRIRLSNESPDDQPTDVTSAGVAFDCAAPTPSPSTAAGSPSLPVTGTPIGWFVAVAGALLVLGGLLLLIVRRRRVTFTN